MEQQPGALAPIVPPSSEEKTPPVLPSLPPIVVGKDGLLPALSNMGDRPSVDGQPALPSFAEVSPPPMACGKRTLAEADRPQAFRTMGIGVSDGSKRQKVDSHNPSGALPNLHTAVFGLAQSAQTNGASVANGNEQQHAVKTEESNQGGDGNDNGMDSDSDSMTNTCTDSEGEEAIRTSVIVPGAKKARAAAMVKGLPPGAEVQIKQIEDVALGSAEFEREYGSVDGKLVCRACYNLSIAYPNDRAAKFARPSTSEYPSMSPPEGSVLRRHLHESVHHRTAVAFAATGIFDPKSGRISAKKPPPLKKPEAGLLKLNYTLVQRPGKRLEPDIDDAAMKEQFCLLDEKLLCRVCMDYSDTVPDVTVGPYGTEGVKFAKRPEMSKLKRHVTGTQHEKAFEVMKGIKGSTAYNIVNNESVSDTNGPTKKETTKVKTGQVKTGHSTSKGKSSGQKAATPVKKEEKPSKKCEQPEVGATTSGAADYKLKCRCMTKFEFGVMVQCDKCSAWVHTRCYGFEDDSQVPEEFVCAPCSSGDNSAVCFHCLNKFLSRDTVRKHYKLNKSCSLLQSELLARIEAANSGGAAATKKKAAVSPAPKGDKGVASKVEPKPSGLKKSVSIASNKGKETPTTIERQPSSLKKNASNASTKSNKSKKGSGEDHWLASRESVLPKLRLQDIFSLHAWYELLTETQRLELGQMLPDCVDLKDEKEVERLFRNEYFTDGLDLFKNCITQGIFDKSMKGFWNMKYHRKEKTSCDKWKGDCEIERFWGEKRSLDSLGDDLHSIPDCPELIGYRGCPAKRRKEVDAEVAAKTKARRDSKTTE